MGIFDGVPLVGQIVDAVENPSNRIKLERKVDRMKNCGMLFGAAVAASLPGVGTALAASAVALFDTNSVKEELRTWNSSDVDTLLNALNIVFPAV